MRDEARKNLQTLRKKAFILGSGFLFLVMAVTSFFGKKGFVDIQRARKEYRALAGEVEGLKAEKAKIEREIEELERNPGAIEKEAREKLWLMKPGEKAIVKPQK